MIQHHAVFLLQYLIAIVLITQANENLLALVHGILAPKTGKGAM